MSKQDQSKDRNIRCVTIVTQEGPDSSEGAHTAAIRNTIFGKDISMQKLAEHPLNVMTLTPQEHTHLLTGPTFSITGDCNFVIRDNVPIRALVASSTKLHDLLQLRPKATEFRVHGKVDRKSVQRLLNIFTTPYIVEATNITLVGKEFAQDVLLYQACLSLGIFHIHTKPLLDTLRAEISARLLSVEERNTIVNRIPPTDPLFKHLANDLCHRRFKKEIPEIADFERWLGFESRKKLQMMMVEIDQEHKKRREVIRGGLGKVTLPKQPEWNVVRKGV